MVKYKLVKFCMLCKERFVVDKTEARRYYCNKCQNKVKKSIEKERNEKK